MSDVTVHEEPEEQAVGVITETSGAEVEVAGPPAALEPGPPAADPVRDRMLLPLLLPIVSSIAFVVLVLNISRVLLASGETGSVVVGSIVTVAILAGAAAISASPRMRTSTLTLIVAGFLVVIMGAGLTTLGPSDDTGEQQRTGYQEPKGAPSATLTVKALPQNRFQADEFGPLPSGIIQIDYVQVGGNHTLVFDDPKLAGFILRVPQGPKTKKVALEPGEYTIFCTIPGHRAGGMEATLEVVNAAPSNSSPDTIAE